MEDFNHLEGDEKLKAENEFLKMKLMLEHGAHLDGNEKSELPEEIENQFLNNVMAFEKQFAEHKTIKLYDKIGRPAHFKRVAEIPDEDIETAWRQLSDYLNEHSIDLSVCSPNISVRELYRFTTEELFEHETNDMNLPGWTTNFIYDEFHPDPVYDNTRAATDDCINYILQKAPIEWTHHFRDKELRLNEHFPLSIDEFRQIVSRYKDAYDSLEINEIAANDCTVIENKSMVTGSYNVTAGVNQNFCTLSGNWKVGFRFFEEYGYWYITEVSIEGIKF